MAMFTAVTAAVNAVKMHSPQNPLTMAKMTASIATANCWTGIKIATRENPSAINPSAFAVFIPPFSDFTDLRSSQIGDVTP